MSRRVWRAPALILLPLLLVAGIVAGGNSSDDRGDEVRTERLGPTAPGPSASGSTWYCAAGSATGVLEGADAGVAEQVLLIANLADEPAEASLTVYRSEGEPVVRTVELPAQARTDVRVSDVASAPWASVVVEVSGGSAAVEHQLAGPQGRSVSPCATQPSATWYFPAGTTRAGTSNVMVLFNPFPDEASVDLTFEADDGTRTPGQFQGLVVPGGGTTVVDVSGVVTLRQELAAVVTARNGRVVAEQLMISDGTDDEPAGLTSSPGAPRPATDWVFPDVIAPGAGREVSVAVFNPGAGDGPDAEVEVQVFLDDPGTNGSVEPFSLSVPGGRYVSQDLFSDARIPEGVGYWVLVRSTNGVPVVAQSLQGGVEGSTLPGFAATMGSPLAAERWYLALASASEVSGAVLTLVNPSATGDVTARVDVHVAGRQEPHGEPIELVVPAGGRVIVDLGTDNWGRPGSAISVEADGPLVVGRTMVFAGGDLSVSAVLPVSGSESLFADLARPEAFDPDAPLTEPGPEGPAVDVTDGSGTTTDPAADPTTTASAGDSTTTTSSTATTASTSTTAAP